MLALNIHAHDNQTVDYHVCQLQHIADKSGSTMRQIRNLLIQFNMSKLIATCFGDQVRQQTI